VAIYSGIRYLIAFAFLHRYFLTFHEIFRAKNCMKFYNTIYIARASCVTSSTAAIGDVIELT